MGFLQKEWGGRREKKKERKKKIVNANSCWLLKRSQVPVKQLPQVVVTHPSSILTIQPHLILPSTQVERMPETLQALEYNWEKKQKPLQRNENHASKATLIFLPKKHKSEDSNYRCFKRCWAPVVWYPLAPNHPKKQQLEWKGGISHDCNPNYIIFKTGWGGIVKGDCFGQGDCFGRCSQKQVVVGFKMLQLFITIQNLRTGAPQ